MKYEFILLFYSNFVSPKLLYDITWYLPMARMYTISHQEVPEYMKYAVTLGQSAGSPITPNGSTPNGNTPNGNTPNGSTPITPNGRAPKPIKSKSKSKSKRSSSGSTDDGSGQHQRKRSKHVRFSGIGSHTRTGPLVTPGKQRIAIPELDPKSKRESGPQPVPQSQKMHRRIVLSNIKEKDEKKNYIIRITSASLNEFEFSTFADEALHHQQQNSDALSDEDDNEFCDDDEESCSSDSCTSSETTSSQESTVSSSDHEFDDTEDDLERCEILHLP